MVLGHDTRTSERTRDIKITEDVSFDSMLLSPNTLKGLKASGFLVPSPIQLHSIPLGKCGFDLLLEAKSGTGKTAVFSVIALEKLDLDKGIQTLVLAPTREIAFQICDVIKTIGAHFKGLSVEVVMGGLPVAKDVEKFKKNVHIAVGSPGRLCHLIKDKLIDVSAVRLMVLDEADKLLEKSFLSDINNIFSLLPTQKQIIMSSATYPVNVKTVMSSYVQNAHHICPDSNSVLLGIEQNVILVPSHFNIVTQTKNRYMELTKILSKKVFKQCLVFCNYQVRVGEIHRMLCRDEWPADKLYGQQEQTERLEALKILQNYQCRILVTTDLAARGIDASNVDLVINFEIPHDWQTYLHRIGRAGRYGSYGSAVSIVCTGDEEKEFRKLFESINIPFDLKYLWSKEPFLRNCYSDTPCHKNGIQSDVQNTEFKLGIKETYEGLWKMLSLDTTAYKFDDEDIPTFQSLCESYEENVKSKSKNIVELMPSLESHNSKDNEPNNNYKHVEVNTLIVPSTIFNPNLILQNFERNKGVEKKSGNNNNINDDGKQNNQCKINSVDCIAQTTVKSKKEKNNENGDIESKILNKSKDRKSSLHDRTIINSGHRSYGPNNDDVNKLYKVYKKANEDYDLNLPSTSGISKYKTNTEATYKNFSKNNKTYKSPIAHISYEKASSKIDVNDEHSESDSSDNVSANKNNDSNDSNSYECNNNYEKSLIAANLPTAFGKHIQWKSGKSKKHKNDIMNKNYFKNKIIEQKSTQRTNINDRKYLDNESSDDDKNIDSTFPHRTQKTSENHSLHNSKSKLKHACLCNQHTEINLRQHQFNIWYQQLRAHMKIIETSVYIDVMSNPYL